MAQGLLEAIQGLHVRAQEDGLLGTNAESIDEILSEQGPRKRRPRKTLDQIKGELIDEFLTPPTSFNEKWLNKLQQRWDVPTDLTALMEMAPTQTRRVVRFKRQGLQGRITGFEEVTVPAHSATAKNSTSLLRKPANRADFVRGAAGFFPFTPGGLDGVEAVAALEEQTMQARQSSFGAVKVNPLERVIDFGTDGGLLQIPPGFTRGLDFSKTKSKVVDEVAKQMEEALSEEPEVPLLRQHYQEAHTDKIPEHQSISGEDDSDSEVEDDIDSLLPVEYPALEPHKLLATSRAQSKGRVWAHMVDVNREITNFRELVPEMARTWPFELDTFQKEAVYHLENGDSVFVAAHTSAGKTVVAEYAIALATKHMTKAIYTSPIKALSNQKFRDFRNEFADVGILTGDVQINPEASCLIMTTEILRSMLYRGADLIRDVEFVIFDEVHYVNDLERGVVWEEVIIMLPEHVTLILLSATVPNTFEFASWVGRTKKKNIYVISTPKRPVPLEHYLWADKAIYKIVDADKKFLDQGWKDANAAVSGKDKSKTTAGVETPGNQRGGASGGRARGQGQRGGPQRGGAQQGRGQAPRTTGNIARTGRGGGRTSAAQDKNVWVHLVQHLKKQMLLPSCIFVFSKKRCEENADALSKLDFCTALEKSAIHMTINRSIARLRPEDRTLPQIRRVQELLARGIAVHHGGLLPIVKELVEILFAKTLVKVLFATETFAMGLNLPTRTVVFSGFRKHDGRAFRDLLPGEYTQMAGRAGRRGLDSVGSVIIVATGSDEAPPAATLKQMILGTPTKLRSQFRLTYNMILNLLRVEALKIEEMIKRSFSENATQALLPEQEKEVRISEADLAKIKREPCPICDIDLDECHRASMAFQSATSDMHIRLLSSPVGRRMFAPRRLIVYHKEGIRTPGLLVREGTSKGLPPRLQVLSLGPKNPRRQPSDLLPYITRFRPYFSDLVTTLDQMELKVYTIPLTDIDCITKTVVRIDIDGLLTDKERGNCHTDKEILQIFESWQSSHWDEMDWSRIKELTIREILERRKQEHLTIDNARSLECSLFVHHFSMRHDEWIITENIAQLRQLMSDQNLQLLPDYEQRIAVLKDLGFVDENSRVELKGKVACEIHSADELVLTELILENVLAKFEPEEIVALLSAFVFQEKTDIEPTLTSNLQRGKEMIIAISVKVNAFQTQHQVILSSDDSNDFVSRPRFGLAEVVYEWARGMSFNRITDLTDVLEGTIVRIIGRLDETCREVKNAARIIGDPDLFIKMQKAQEMIKRDITAVASLYILVFAIHPAEYDTLKFPADSAVELAHVVSRPPGMDVGGLRDRIQSTLDTNADIRRQAEIDLKYAENQPGFTSALLDILQAEQDNGVRLSTVVYLKNRVTRGWAPGDEYPNNKQLAEEEKLAFRNRLIPIIASSPSQIRSQLIPCLQKILHFDFPAQWPDFMDITVQLLNTNDGNTVFTGLNCMLAICRVYRFKGPESRGDFSRIVQASFPQLLSIGTRLTNEDSLEVWEMLRILLKAYKHAIYLELPAQLMTHESMVGWCTLFLTIVGKEAPDHLLNEDPEEKERNHFFKCKKWAYANLNRLFIRYGNPSTHSNSNAPELAEFSKSFITNFAPEILKSYLQQIDRWALKNIWLSKPSLSYSLIFLDECVKPKPMWNHLKPHMDSLISHVLFPLLCQTDDDIEQFDSDPSEYLHRKLNHYEEVTAPDVAASNFLVSLTKSRKKQTFTILSFINGIVNKYEASPDELKDARQKEGALRMIGTLASVILGKKSPIADQVEYFFVRHVFPEFRSPQGYLRARACDTLGKFEALEFKDPSNLLLIYRNILESMADPCLPVRIEAALALQPFIRHDVIRVSMQQNIGQIMQQLLKLANEVDVDSLANVMEDFVEEFSTELTPFAVALSEQLRDTYLRIVRELLERQNAKEEEEGYGDFLDDKSITALGVLQTIGTLILSLETSPEVLMHLETILLPVVSITLENKLYDLYNEVFEIIDSCTFSAKSVSPTMWQAFELMHKTFKAGAELYLEDMLPALDNFVTYGAETLIKTPGYIQALVEMVSDIFYDEKVGGMDRICGCKLAESIMLNLRGHVDQYIPEFVKLAMTVISSSEPKVKSYRIHLMEMVINAIYYDPILALRVLELNGWTNKFFSSWFSNIESFSRVHDKKLSIVAITALMTLRADDIPSSVQQGWPRLLQGIVQLFKTLPAAQENRENATKESDFILNDDDDDEVDDEEEWDGDATWTNETDDGEGDIKDENSAYLDFLHDEVQKFNPELKDEDEDALQEESLLETPLDRVEPYGLFKSTLFTMRQGQPQLYETLTKFLSPEEQQVVESVVNQADIIMASAAAAVQSNGNLH